MAVFQVILSTIDYVCESCLSVRPLTKSLAKSFSSVVVFFSSVLFHMVV